MLNLLIINDNINYCKSLLNYISEKSSKIRIYSIANTLSEGINILNTGAIDIVLIDIKYSIDTILNSFKNIENTYYEKYRSSFIVIYDRITSNNSHDFIHSYILSSNTQEEIILSKINEIIETKISNFYNLELINKINQELKYIGYNLSYYGTKYLCECIALAYNNSENCDNLNKDIYPIIAKKHNKNINNIKCNITKATNAMYYDCEEARLKDYFHFYTVTQPKPKLVLFTILNKLQKK